MWARLGMFSHSTTSPDLRPFASFTISERGWTPIFDAALHSHEVIIEQLVKAGADLTKTDMLGYTAEKYADEKVWERATKGAKKKGGDA